MRALFGSGITWALLVILGGAAAPALAALNENPGLHLGASTNAAVRVRTAESDVAVGADLRAKGDLPRAERLQQRIEERADKAMNKVEKRLEADETKTKVRGEVGSDAQGRASYGRFVSGIHKESNTFGRWLTAQLREERDGVNRLPAEARAKLYADILAKIHAALLTLRADISVMISAAVSVRSGGSSSSSSSVSSGNSSSSSSSSSST